MLKTATLKLINVKKTAFALGFTLASVALPMIAHILVGPSAGQLFLPIQLFVFAAALLLGWQAGIIVGILSALISFSLTGMPPAAILPIITIELALYGFLAGYFFRDKKWNLYPSLIGAMALGRIILIAVISILPVKVSAINYVFSAAKTGAIGIAIQLILVPLIYASLKKYFSDERI